MMDIQRLVSNGKISKLKNNLDKEIFKNYTSQIILFFEIFSRFDEVGIFGLLSYIPYLLHKLNPRVLNNTPNIMLRTTL